MRAAKKRISGKAIALIVAAALLLTVTVGITVAYLMAETPPLTNNFEPVAVDCLVNESFADNIKKDVTVQNTGDISAYIRATVVINWVSESGSVYGGAPVEGTDYTVEFGQNGWFKGSDGFYYYQAPITPGGSTANLINRIFPVAGAAPEGYTLSVQVLASAIQAEPAAAIAAAWPAVTVNSDGTLAP